MVPKKYNFYSIFELNISLAMSSLYIGRHAEMSDLE